jgi:hypothetical protein
MTFNQNDSVFAGMSQPALQAALSSAQTALIALQSGAQVATVTYSMGEGNRSVTYRRSNPGALVQLINELKACLGMATHARRGFRVSF